jgi:nucleotide-binding universal stress UspA family protein
MKERMKILIAYDGSECADAALLDLQRAGLPRRAAAIVLAVTESWLPPPSGLEIVGGITHEQEYLALARQARARLQQSFPEWELEAQTAFGSPASVLLKQADEWRPDLIVVGSHGRSALGRFFFGSVSQKVLHEAHCSVRVARLREGRVADEPVRIIIGVDGSRGAAAAINAVATRHWPEGSEARLVNGALSLPRVASEQAALELEKWLAEENARIKEMIESGVARLCATGLFASPVVKGEEPKRLLCAEAENWRADTIFLGARGVGRLERFLIGSVSAGVAARADCSVEIVRD